MSMQAATRLELRPTDELEALPERSSVAELIDDGSDRGRLELLPAREQRASDWYPQAVGPKGGDFVPAWWSDDPVIYSSPVRLFRLRDAYYVPAFGAVISSTGEVMSASVEQAICRTPDLSVLPYAERRAELTVIDLPDQLLTLDRVVVTMPWAAVTNYGHFLLDCLPTVASIAEIPTLRDFRFAFPSLKPWQRRHLQLAGVEAPLELDQPIYRVSDVIWASSMGFFLHRPNVSYRTLRNRQLARAKSSGAFSKKVYLTRRGNPKRIFRSEPELEERLEAEGFDVVAPEELSVDEQIGAFRGADVVVGCAGAAFANVLYCQPGTKIIEITPARMVTPYRMSGVWVYNICAIIGCKWRPYYCADVSSKTPVMVAGAEVREIGFSFDLDLDDLLGYVGGLTSPS